MIYPLSNPQEATKATEYLKQAIRNGWLVEIKRKLPQRSLNQNSFFHLLVGYFGIQQGYSLEEMKAVVKRHMSDVFVYEKNGYKFMRSSAGLDKEEMTKVIDRLYRLAADMGVTLPLVDNAETQALMSNEIEKNRY